MSIELTPQQLAEIQAHGAQTFPEECCGFLLGAAAPGHRVVKGLRPTRNVREASARDRRYLVDPRAFLEAETEARASRWEIVGIYHSHPNEAAVPSDYDREHAWPWYSYLILSVLDSRPDALRSWVLRDDRSCFDEERLLIQPQGEVSCR